MTTKKIKSSDILGDNYYIYELTSSNYNPNPNNTITITCTVKNVYGNLIANKAVQLYQNDTAVGNAATTNNNGIATWTITCSNSGVQKFSVKNTIIEVLVKGSASDLEIELVPKSEDSDGIMCVTGGELSYDLDKVYPVGSIYMSVNSTNPSTLFGGTWEQLTDTFLYASTTADTNSTTATSGSKDAVVVDHNHTQASHNHGSGDSTYPNFMTTNINIAVGQTKRTLPSAGSEYYYVYSKEKGDIGQHSVTDSKQPTINNKGVSGTDKNMPPYMKVFMWKRTA